MPMPNTPVPSAATEASLEARVATAIWGYVDDYGIGRAVEVIALVRAEVASEIRGESKHYRPHSGVPAALNDLADRIARGESR